jgi:phosphatidylserine/phosphatidylglycerophosphate/cardiolipin synthase-like enzyme
VAALDAAVERGVAVRIIVDRSIDEQMRVLLSGVAARGMEIRTSSVIYIHAKLMLVDNEIALVGSHNPTPTSLDRNREVSMVVDDPFVIQRAEAIFARDWTQSSPFGGSGSQNGVEPGANAFHVYRLQIRTEPTSMAAAHPASTTC